MATFSLDVDKALFSQCPISAVDNIDRSRIARTDKKHLGKASQKVKQIRAFQFAARENVARFCPGNESGNKAIWNEDDRRRGLIGVYIESKCRISHGQPIVSIFTYDKRARWQHFHWNRCIRVCACFDAGNSSGNASIGKTLGTHRIRLGSQKPQSVCRSYCRSFRCGFVCPRISFSKVLLWLNLIFFLNLILN